VGRSNVGKSSLINFLLQKKDIAKISSKPGKTRLINHFLVNGNWYLVDLPGYGFAKLSKKEKEQLDGIVHSYVSQRANLVCLFVLLDCRHAPMKNDLAFMRQLGENQVPFVMVFTKTDKLSNNKLEKNIGNYQKIMKKDWEALPRIFKTSTLQQQGRDEIVAFIEQTNQAIG
jgi:GTP-binding protein